MRTMVVALGLCISGLALLSAQTAPTSDDLARRVQAHYDSVKDFQTDFTQTYRGGFTKPLPPEKGRLLVKKPGRMYMKYEGPDKQEYWTDGIRAYSYVGSRKEGQVSPLPTGNDAPATVLLLMGQGNIVRDFSASMTGDQPQGQWRLTLVPKKSDGDTRSLVLIVDRATLKLLSLEKKDSQDGTSTWLFSNLKENVGLADKEFIKSFPAGTKTEIVR